MQPSSMHYFPLAWPFLLILLIALLGVVALVAFDVLKYTYERMGIPSRHVFGILLVSLLGSAVNIPVAQLPPEEMAPGTMVDFYGVRYVVPVVHGMPGPVIAVNVGGALIPVLLSVYLLTKYKFYVRGVLAIAAVALVTNLLAVPVRGVGIAVPIFVPPIVAAGTAMVLGWRHAPPLAYIGGSIGTLVGADLLNLGKIRGLGAPIASIGGAGTFDGVFLTGILAVLLSAFAGSRPSQESR